MIDETTATDDAAVSRVLTVAVRANPALAPRMAKCVVCKEVAALEDVAYRLYDEHGQHRRDGTREAGAYVRSIGMGGTPQTVYNRLVRHRAHIDAWMNRGGPVAPANIDTAVQRIPPRAGDVRWLDAQQRAMDVGYDALAILAGRLEGMETKDLVAVAKLGTTAAGQRGSLEAKGKALSQVDQLLRLMAGGSGE